MNDCDSCLFYNYDEDIDLYVCDCNMDEDEYENLLTSRTLRCPFYRDGDEYKTARKQ